MLSPRHASSPSPSSPGSMRRQSSSSPEAHGQEHDNVHVICRVRPFNNREIELHEEANEKRPEYERYPIRSVVEFDGSQCIFLDSTTWQERERFTFDHCYWSIPDDVQACEGSPFAGQAALYTDYGTALLTQAWKGYNTCFFAYGQTGSGKTHSMMGNLEREAEEGLIPRLGQQLFRDIEQTLQDSQARFENIKIQFRVEVRYIEIYNERVSDLLWSQSMLPPEVKSKCNPENLRVRSSPATGVFVEHQTAVEVASWEEMLKLINMGNSFRHTAATKMNDRSSRSHAIFKITLSQITTSVSRKQFERPTEHVRESVINLVDLAGSERNKKTGATGDRLKEAASINKSLSCLKGVIEVLIENSVKGAKKRPPYRDSTLTSLLMDSLGGNSKTFMLVCVSPHSDNEDETVQALRYGSRARQIVHAVHVNESASGRMLLDLQEELERMRKELERTSTDDRPGSVDALRNKIDEQEQLVSVIMAQIDEQNESIWRMREAAQREIRMRQAFAASNLTNRSKLIARRDEMRAEYLQLTERLRVLQLDAKNTDEEYCAEKQREVEARLTVESNTQKAVSLEHEYDALRKKVTRLEMYCRELLEAVAEQAYNLQQRREEKHAVVLRGRLQCARIRLESRAEIADLQRKHDSKIAALQADADAELAAVSASLDDQEQMMSQQNTMLRKTLEAIEAETRRIRVDGTSQIAQLEEELRSLQAERRRKTQETNERLDKVKREWDEAFARMESDMEAKLKKTETDWLQRDAVAAENNRTTRLQLAAERAVELQAASKHWDAAIDAIGVECAQDQAAAEAEWDSKIAAAIAKNKGLRGRLRHVEQREMECRAMMRQVAAALENCPTPSASSSDDFRKLYALLIDFQAEYEQAPAMYRLQHLLRESLSQTRCRLAPLVGVADDEQPYKHQSATAAPGDGDQSAIRMRARSPRLKGV